MTTTLTNISAALCAALFAACGGSSGNAALSKTFTYGAAVAPTTSEQTAASSAQDGLSSTTSFSSTPDVNKGAAIVGFAETISTIAFGSSGFGVAPRGTDLRGALRAADYSNCSTVTGNTVTFTNCSETTSGDTFTWS